MNFLRVFAVIVLPVILMTSAATASEAKNDWYGLTKWRLTMALQRTPMHLTPRRTKAEVRLTVTANGEVTNVSVSSIPPSKELDMWIKKKLENVNTINPHPSGKDHKLSFALNYTDTSN